LVRELNDDGTLSFALTSLIRLPMVCGVVKSNGVPLTLTFTPSGIWVVSVGVYLLALIWTYWP
jgi:hypothetical protein